MEFWSKNSKKAVYFITMALTILFPIAESASVLITMIMWLSDFEEISYSDIVMIITCVLSLLYLLALLLITIFRHFRENAFYKVYPVAAYIISAVVEFNIIVGMDFSTLSARFPLPGIGFVTIPSEYGRIVLIGFFVSIAMVFLSGINVKAKSLI